MSKETAKGYYLNKMGVKRHNCAQSVIAAFSEKFGFDENVVKSFADYGHGMAPGGECGALCAAKFMLKGKHADKIKSCEEAFITLAGSSKCKEIRKLRKLSCVGCVERSAEFIEKLEGQVLPDDRPVHASDDHRHLSLEGQVRLIAGSLVLISVLLAWLIHWAFIFIAVFAGCGLVYAGITDNCLMAILLMRLPYNSKRVK